MFEHARRRACIRAMHRQMTGMMRALGRELQCGVCEGADGIGTRTAVRGYAREWSAGPAAECSVRSAVGPGEVRGQMAWPVACSVHAALRRQGWEVCCGVSQHACTRVATVMSMHECMRSAGPACGALPGRPGAHQCSDELWQTDQQFTARMREALLLSSG
jgi:hypothetical protein